MVNAKHIHDDGANVDGAFESLHFLLAELYSSQNVSKETTPNLKHIVFDPFDKIYCSNSNSINTKVKRANSTKKAKSTKGAKGAKSTKTKLYDKTSSKTRKLSKTKTKTQNKNDANNKQMPYINVIVDSGATRHCCNNLDIMTNIRNTNVNIMVGNGNIIQATKMGDIGCIKDVLYLPEIKHFLFSISYMLHTAGKQKYRVEFFHGGFDLKFKRKIIARGILASSNLYVMRVSLPKKFQKYTDSNTAISLFINLEKSGISATELEELKGNMPISFEYI